MSHKCIVIALAIIFAVNDSVSSASINADEISDFVPLPTRLTFLDDNSISRAKRQAALDVSAEVDPPAVAAPLPEAQPATKATTALPTTTKPTPDIAGPGFEVIDLLSQAGVRIGQRLNARLDKLQSGINTPTSSQVDAITDLLKSGISTGAKIPTTALKLLVAKLRLPLYVLG